MAEPLTELRGTAVPILRDNIDTDTISPGSAPPWRKSATFGERGSATLADDLFANWRYTGEGRLIESFPLNEPRYQGARFLITGANFGCGSSRESAVWMLAAWGIRCVIAPSFAEIFSANCFANGLLPVVLANDLVSELADEASSAGGAFELDLAQRSLRRPSGRDITFHIPEYRRQGLMRGLDDIAQTLNDLAAIQKFVATGRRQFPWIYRRAAW
ncbi:3-isopropylmalate dehydratase small subunit [Bradyrhizobium sp. SSBR45G]|nr:3-isopropylmalate dehydratase small subunit [Bradyrhizobium sp. SSBR45G]GLH84274.1 3-isopropylmalate dehydratase small subunit [Bradyrhizobium sp. SSBR45R]